MSQAPATTTHRPEHIGLRHAESAARDLRAHVLLWGVAALGVAADLWTKSWAFRTLDPVHARPWIGGVLDFQLSLNAGALFGIGAGKGTVFIVASVAALGFVLYLFSGTSRRQGIMHVALALILAGALGNLYDRTVHRYDRVQFAGSPQALIGWVESAPDAEFVVVRPWYRADHVTRRHRSELAEPVRRVGVVRDFLRFVPSIGGRALWPWVFNVADVLLVVGVGLMIIGYWRSPHGAGPAPRRGGARTDKNESSAT